MPRARRLRRGDRFSRQVHRGRGQQHHRLCEAHAQGAVPRPGSAALLVRVGTTWRPAANLAGTAVTQADVLAGTPQLLTVSALAIDGDGNSLAYEDMGLAPLHPRFASASSCADKRRARLDRLLPGFSAGDAGMHVFDPLDPSGWRGILRLGTRRGDFRSARHL